MMRRRTIIVRRRIMFRLALTTSIATLVGSFAALGAASPAVTSGELDGAWKGTYTQIQPAELALTIAGGKAEVALGAGHATLQPVKATLSGERLRLVVPGR